MKWKRTPQGYVITTATITRAGPIEYYGHELGLTGSDANKKSPLSAPSTNYQNLKHSLHSMASRSP